MVRVAEVDSQSKDTVPRAGLGTARPCQRSRGEVAGMVCHAAVGRARARERTRMEAAPIRCSREKRGVQKGCRIHKSSTWVS